MQVSIINYQTLIKASHSFRFDADFFRQDYLRIQELLEFNKGKKLKDLNVSIYHPKEINRIYVVNGVLFFRAQNIRPLSINISRNPVFINSKDAQTLQNNVINYKDILLTRTGANFGQCAIYLNNEESVASSHTFIIKSGKVNAFFLTVFLNTKYGRKMIDKGMYGGSQPEVAPYFLYQIPIPEFEHIQNIIENIYLKSEELITLSGIKYKEAKNLILTELGLINWQPKHQLWFVKNYSDTKQAKRIDAEYYQPKYDEIINAIKNYSDGWDILGNLVTIKGQNFYPKNKKLYQYIELANIDGNGEIAGCMTEEGQDLPTRARREVTMGDVVVSSIEGSLSSIALIEKEYNHALCSTGFYVINSELFNAETLLVLLKSIVGQLQLKKGCNGTILTAINKDEFSKVVLPKVPKVKQTQIQQKVIESFNLRKQSKHLLECAKRAVEMAIEQDEQTAIRWLENET